MPSYIQAGARGLLSLLRATSDGQQPNAFADQVNGVIDLTPMYGVTRREMRSATIQGSDIIAGGVGLYIPASLQLRPEADRLFMVRYLGAHTVAATGGANFAFSVGWWREDEAARVSNIAAYVQHGQRATAPPSGGMASAGGQCSPFHLQTPGEQPVLFVEAGSASASQVQIVAIFDRLRY